MISVSLKMNSRSYFFSWWVSFRLSELKTNRCRHLALIAVNTSTNFIWKYISKARDKANKKTEEKKNPTSHNIIMMPRVIHMNTHTHIYTQLHIRETNKKYKTKNWNIVQIHLYELWIGAKSIYTCCSIFLIPCRDCKVHTHSFVEKKKKLFSLSSRCIFSDLSQFSFLFSLFHSYS